MARTDLGIGVDRASNFALTYSLPKKPISKPALSAYNHYAKALASLHPQIKETAVQTDGSSQVIPPIMKSEATQTDLVLQVAVPAMESMTTQYEVDDFTAPDDKYPLNDLQVAVIDVSTDANPNLAEYAPYVEGAGKKVSNPDGWLTTKMKGGFEAVSDLIYWNARSVATTVSSWFGQTEYQLLMAIDDPNQQIRATKTRTSLFSPTGGEREQLYGLSSGVIRSVLLDPFFSFVWNEGFKRADRFNTLELLKVVPYILLDELERVNTGMQAMIEPLLKQAATVLKDPNYGNMDYLTELEQELRDAITTLEVQAAKLAISGKDNAEGTHEAVSKKLKAMKRADFAHFTQEDDRRYRVSYLDLKRDEAFRFGSRTSHAATNMQESISREFISLPNTSVEDKKRRIQVLAQHISDFRNHAAEQIGANKIFLADIKRHLAQSISKDTVL